MKTPVSVITRDGSGPLRIVSDRVPIEHSDDHSEIDAALAGRIEAGDDMVLILLGDDSVARHWTRPANIMPDEGESVLGQAPKGRAARRHVAKKKAKKRSK